MRKTMVTAAVLSVVVLGLSGVCGGTSIPVGALRPLGVRALQIRMDRNLALANVIALRGYPDWVEEVEVASELPLDTHEVRLYYLRLGREIAFTDAYILGRPTIGIRLYDRPLDAETRMRIERAYLMHDPVRRAELAAENALAAAERTERAADAVEAAADKAEGLANELERSFFRAVRK